MMYVNNSDELYHYGVKGMRWGHRKASYQNTAAGQRYRDAKAAKKAAGKAYSKAYNKAYNRNFAAFSPIKKHRDANTARWEDAIKKGQELGKANKEYKDAKKEYHQSDEYKAKRAKAIKVGAAVAGTALAAYGAYKVSKVLKDKAASKAYKLGEERAKRWLAASVTAAKKGDAQTHNIAAGMVAESYLSGDDTARRVRSSTVEAAKYLYKNRGR